MKRTMLVSLILGTVLVVAPAARAQALSPESGGGLASRATSVPVGMTQPEYRALMLRSAALNARYGNPLTDMTPQQFKAAYLAGMARANGASGNALRPTDSSGSKFDWRYVAIAALGAVLLAWTSVMFTRRRHQPTF